MKFLELLVPLLKDHKGLANIILLGGIMFNGYTINQTNLLIANTVHRAETNYAMNVVIYGLQGVTTEEQIYNQIEEWHQNEWGAQVGGIQTICRSNPNRLEEIVSPEMTKSICRLVRMGN